MNALTKILSPANNIVGIYTLRDLSSMCLLETGMDDFMLGRDGSLASIIEVAGTEKLGSRSDLEQFSAGAFDVLAPFMRSPGYAMQFCFMRNPENSHNVMSSLIRPQRDVAGSIGLDMDDILQERIGHLAKYVVDERSYIVLWTRPSILSKPEAKTDKFERKKSKPSWWPKAVDAQKFDALSNIMISRHRAYVEAVISGFSRIGIKTGRLRFNTAVRMIRENVYQRPQAHWRPFAPGSHAKSMMPWPRHPVIGGPEDVSHLLWPDIASQIFDSPAQSDGKPGIVLGNMRYAPVDVSRGPTDPRAFNDLINNIRDMGEEPPWRIAFLLEGGALNSAWVMINAMIATMTAPFFSTSSKLYSQAVKDLRHYQNERNGVTSRIRISLTTWAPESRPELVDIRVNRIQRAVESWGSCETKLISGDYAESVMATVPALDVRSTAPAGLAPLDQALFVMPWMRESSPWAFGSMNFRTRDGRPFPYSSGSTLQTGWVEIVYGAMGKGKSFLLNTMGLAFCLSPDATVATGGAKLPRLIVVDIGSSVSGMINVIRSALPVDRQHEAIFHRLKMDRSNSVNPFDLPLGLSKPMPQQRDYLRNLITIIASPDKQGEGFTVRDGMMELVGKVIDEAYIMADDRGRNSAPKLYARGENGEVDEAIERYGIMPEEHKTWYGLARALFSRGAIREATVAQRYAVPRLQDLLITDQPNIAAMYQTDPNLPREFERMIQAAQNDYPILCGVTEIDFSSARVLAIDLSAVAPKGNIKQTAVMYMVGMQIGMGDIYLHKDDLEFIPEAYKKYYTEIIARLNENQKCLVLDEFHRTAGVNMVRRQVTWVMREGRKYGLIVRVASQQIRDFDDEMIDSATTMMICGVNTAKEIEYAENNFKLSPAAARSLHNIVTGPTNQGAPILALFRLAGQPPHEHIVFNTVGPRESWAFSTSQQSAELRNRLSERIGDREARRRLGRAYPSGSADSVIKARARALAIKSGNDLEQSEFGAIDEIIQEIVENRHAGTNSLLDQDD